MVGSGTDRSATCPMLLARIGATSLVEGVDVSFTFMKVGRGVLGEHRSQPLSNHASATPQWSCLRFQSHPVTWLYRRAHPCQPGPVLRQYIAWAEHLVPFNENKASWPHTGQVIAPEGTTYPIED